jgi:hypothetical protein
MALMSTHVKEPRVLAAMLLIALQTAGCEPLPHDEVLIARFRENRKSFERLLLIAQAQWNRYQTIDITSDGDTEAHRIMKKLGIRHVLGPTGNRVTFHCDTGLNPDSKGFVYFPPESNEQPPDDETLSSLDAVALREDLEAYPTRYRALGDGWYLFVQLDLDNGKTKADVTRNK